MVSSSDNSIRPRLGSVSVSSPRVGQKPVAAPTEDRKKHQPPKHRGFTSIPAPDVLEKMIERALAALQRGIFWDRGSIINLMV